jgi:hypothetical protein
MIWLSQKPPDFPGTGKDIAILWGSHVVNLPQVKVFQKGSKAHTVSFGMIVGYLPENPRQAKLRTMLSLAS